MNEHEDEDLQPSYEEVLKQEVFSTPEPPVDVRLVDSRVPVSVQQLPHYPGATRTRAVGTTLVTLLGADHRRARATVIASGGSMLVAFRQSDATDPSTMLEWPAGVSLPITASSGLIVQAKTGTITVAYITEMWAMGEGVQ